MGGDRRRDHRCGKRFRQPTVIAERARACNKSWPQGPLLGLWKYALGPDPQPHRAQGVREGHGRLAGPSHAPRSLRLGQRVVQQRRDRVGPEQARRGPQHGPTAPAPGRLGVEAGPALLEGAFDAPAAGVSGHDLGRSEGRVGRVGVLVPVRALEVAGVGPADRDQPVAGLVPVPRPGDDRHPSGPAAVPPDGDPTAPAGRLDRLARLGPALPLDPRPPVAAGGRRGREEARLGVELADQREPAAMAAEEAGDLVAAVARVADEGESAAGAADHEGAEQPAHEPGRGPVRPPAEPVVLLGAVQVHEHRQGAGPGGEGEAGEHRQHDPAMAVLPGGVGARGADRVAVPGLAVDLAARVAVDGVIPDQGHRPVRDQMGEDGAGQGTPEAQPRPRGPREDALIVGAMPRRQRAQAAEQVGDGAPALRADGRGQEGGEASGGGPGEVGREGREQRRGLVG